MNVDSQSEANSTSQAVRAVADVAKLVIEPISTVAQTYADSFHLRKLAKTQIEVEKLKVRAKINLDAEIIRHQINKEQILKKAEEILRAQEERKELSHASGEKVEEDWVFKWANLAKDVSDETVQCLWAKVLAGELIKPGKYSFRLLSALASFRKADAIIFDRFSNYVWEGPSKTFFQLCPKEAEDLIERKHGINYGFYSQLQSMGLIDTNQQLGIAITPKNRLSALYGNNLYSFTTSRENLPLFRARLLTSVGAELFSLCTPQPDTEYAETVKNWAFNNGITPAWSDDCDLHRDFVKSQPFPKFEIIRESTAAVWL